MSAIQKLLTDHIDIWTSADTEKKSGRGRSSGNAASVYGIKKLRELILELAVRGKLVPQDPNDEPASELLKRIMASKAKLIAEGHFKKDKPLPPVNEEQEPYQLPVSWEWVRLGAITNFGVTEKLDSISDNTWVLDLEDIEKDTSKLIQKARFSERNSLSAKNSFQAGDVLYGKLRPYLNKVIVADEAGVCTTEILPVRCFGEFCSDYFKLALKSPCFIDYVNVRSYGMKMPRLGTEDGRKALFPLPPLAEQHRIVTKVDELMALCDQLEAQHNNAADAHEKLVSHLLGTLTDSQSAADFSENWQRIVAHFDMLFTTEASIDALKQTLLQLAVQGRLVPQDPREEPATKLRSRIEAEKNTLIAEGKIRKQKALPVLVCKIGECSIPSGWEIIRFGELFNLISGQHLMPSEYEEVLVEGMIPYLTGPAEFGEKSPRATRFTREQRAVAPKDSVLITCKGSGVGKLNLASEPIAISRQLMAMQPILVPSRYIYLLAESMESAIRERIVGIAIPGISREDVTEAPVLLPPLAEQFRIIDKVDELTLLCEKIKFKLGIGNKLQMNLANALVECAGA